MPYTPPTPRTLADVIAGSPAARALVCTGGGPTLTRGALAAAVLAATADLKALGVGPGDVVTIVDVNTVDFIVAFLAVTCARGVAAPLNAAYKEGEFAFYIEDAGARLVLLPGAGGASAAGGAPGPRAAAAKLGVPVAALAVAWAFGGGVSVTTTPQSPSLRPLPPRAPDAANTAALAADPPRPADTALFLHTSGTTSRPKGVPLTHANLAASLTNIAATYELTPDDCSFLVMPLFHVHGLMAGLLAPLAAAAAVGLPPEGRFAASTFWAGVSECRASFYTAVPTMHQVLLARGPGERAAAGTPRLRFIRSCSSALAAPTLARLEAAFAAPVLEAYAMTEASHQMTANPLPSHGPHKPGTVGRAAGGVAVAVLDGENRVITTPGTIGEVCIRGANVTAGYRNNPAANAEAYAGGWFHTGDQGSLDVEGYLTLTGRLKELINRGGEKISPLEVDAALLAHPSVGEAVSFGAPDEKYGEVVAAAVVLVPGAAVEGAAESIRAAAAKTLASFKVPSRIFITDAVPKTATGKVQRRFVAEHFCKAGGAGGGAGAAAVAPAPTGARAPAVAAATSPAPRPPPRPPPPGSAPAATPANGYALVATALAALGVRLMVGVVGIPVTELASAAQAAGIRFIGFRNEQAAGYGAAAAGFLTRTPAALLTVSGPGLVHALAGASHAQANCWPLLILSGSAPAAERGRGGFQELDQVAAARPFCKWVGAASSASDVAPALGAALRAAVRGRPGAAYVDLPADMLMGRVGPGALAAAGLLSGVEGGGAGAGAGPSLARHPHPSPGAGAAAALPPLPSGGGATDETFPDPAALAAAVALLKSAPRPLIVIGKGAAYARADGPLRALVSSSGIPFLATSMGRGVVPDDHPACANAARRAALSGASVAVIFGARLNWQLHFGDAPRWAPDVRFILVDPEPSPGDVARAAVVLRLDAGVGAAALEAALEATTTTTAHISRPWSAWAASLAASASSARAKLDARLASADASPLDYWTAMAAIKAALGRLQQEQQEHTGGSGGKGGPHGGNAPPPLPPVIVSEGANTMDMARLCLGPAIEGRCRIDAGTWGTMGVGLGSAIAAAAVGGGHRRAVAVEGDSALGFSLAELETAARHALPVTVIVFNNGGIYGGDRREAGLAAAAAAGAAAGGFEGDPPPTAFVPGARHDLVMAALGGRGFRAASKAELGAALDAALRGGPALVDIIIDPAAGEESGSVHAFNAPKETSRM